MSTNIVLKGEPKSSSHIYKIRCQGGFPRMYLDPKKGKDLKEDYAWQAKQQFKASGKKNPYKGDLEVWITIYFGTKRGGDWDNFHKLSMDALTGIVWEDDKQILEAHVSKRYDKKDPRIEVNILVIDNRQ